MIVVVVAALSFAYEPNSNGARFQATRNDRFQQQNVRTSLFLGYSKPGVLIGDVNDERMTVYTYANPLRTFRLRGERRTARSRCSEAPAFRRGPQHAAAARHEHSGTHDFPRARLPHPIYAYVRLDFLSHLYFYWHRSGGVGGRPLADAQSAAFSSRSSSMRRNFCVASCGAFASTLTTTRCWFFFCSAKKTLHQNHFHLTNALKLGASALEIQSLQQQGDAKKPFFFCERASPHLPIKQTLTP